MLFPKPNPPPTFIRKVLVQLGKFEKCSKLAWSPCITTEHKILTALHINCMEGAALASSSIRRDSLFLCEMI